MPFSSAVLKKIIAVYLAVGGVIALLVLVRLLGWTGIINYLLPVTFSMIILVYIILCATRYYFKPDKLGGQLLLSCLAIQSVFFVILGVGFENHFGPFLGVWVSGESGLTFSAEFDILGFSANNGYSKAGRDLIVGINLVPIGLLILIDVIERQEKKNDKDEEFTIGV